MTLASRFSRILSLRTSRMHALAAQAQVVGGTIGGVVHDISGATVSEATVTVRQAETGATRTLTTDSEGRFFAPSVPVGAYTVAVQHEGFATQQQTGISLDHRTESSTQLRSRRCRRAASRSRSTLPIRV